MSEISKIFSLMFLEEHEDVTMTVPGAPQFEMGQEVLVFVDDDNLSDLDKGIRYQRG